MILRSWAWLLFFSTVGAEVGVAGLVPVEAFARSPDFAAASLSPDGRTMAYLYRYKERQALGFLDLATGKVKAIEAGLSTNVGIKQSIASYRWIGDERVVFHISAWGGRYDTGLAAVNRDGSKLSWLSGVNHWEHNRGNTSRSTFWGSRIVHSSIEDPGRILLASTPDPGVDGARRPEVVQMHTSTGVVGVVQKNPGHIREWIADPSGRLRFALAEEGSTVRLLYREDQDKPWLEPVDFGTVTRPFRYVGVDATGTTLYASKPGPNGCWGLYAFDLVERQWSEPLFHHERYNLASAVFTRDERALLGVRFFTEGPQQHWFSPRMKSVQQQLNEAQPGLFNAVISMDRTMSRMLVLSFSAREPGIYSLLDLETQQWQEIGRNCSWIDATKMAEMYPIRCRARDGLELHGYLTVPPDRERKNLPLVMLVHGGPWARDEWKFNPLVQFLANRGYAVLQINYRGSEGYGEEFLYRGKFEIGRAIQDDITDAVQWAVQQGIGDAQRVAIMGGSYRGYSTLFALGASPDLYRCGIAYASVSDWNDFYRRKDEDDYREAFRFWSEQVGDLKDEQVRRRLEAVSPVGLAGQFKAPVLLVHGDRDRIVPISQSKAMGAALKNAGRTFDTLYLRDVGHEWPTDKPGVAFLTAVETFLATHLKP